MSMSFEHPASSFSSICIFKGLVSDNRLSAARSKTAVSNLNDSRQLLAQLFARGTD